jgi:hypothetical protein
MTDHIINLKVRVWGCNIKSNIQAELLWEHPEVKQGDDINLKLSIAFDPEDLPKFIEVAQKQDHPNPGFTLPEAMRDDIFNANLDLEIPLTYDAGDTGLYKVEINFRHAEFGTQLADVEPITFHMVTPDVEIISCKTDKARVSHGVDFNLNVNINSPSPQKLRGIIFGSLITDDPLIHKMYELEPKRISVQGEKEILWHITVPHDESETGKLRAIIEFKSKETFSKREFDDLIEIRQTKLLRLNSLKSSVETLSTGDELVIDADLENIGLEDVNCSVYPRSLATVRKDRLRITDRRLRIQLQKIRGCAGLCQHN